MTDYVELYGNRADLSPDREIVTRDGLELARTWHAPTVGGTSTPLQQFGDGSNDLYYLFAALAPPDDVFASDWFVNGSSDLEVIIPGNHYVFAFADAITRFDMLCIGDGAGGASTAGHQFVVGTDDEVDARALMVTFDWAAALSIRLVHLSITQRYSASGGAPDPSVSQCRALIRGASYA